MEAKTSLGNGILKRFLKILVRTERLLMQVSVQKYAGGLKMISDLISKRDKITEMENLNLRSVGISSLDPCTFLVTKI